MDSFGVREIGFSEFPAWIGFDDELRLASHGLATATLVVLLICTSRESLAEGVAQGSASGGIGGGTAPAVLAAITPPAAAGSLVGVSPLSSFAADTAVAVSAPAPVVDGAMIRRVRQLDALLAVRSRTTPLSPRQVDAAIAAAVARGHEKGLEKKQPFRKQSNDLFRTQRSLQLGNQEMLVRLRLRAKTRDAMSVELRF